MQRPTRATSSIETRRSNPEYGLSKPHSTKAAFTPSGETPDFSQLRKAGGGGGPPATQADTDPNALIKIESRANLFMILYCWGRENDGKPPPQKFAHPCCVDWP